MSHPSRVRGLKLRVGHMAKSGEGSHPSRVRGLKRLIGSVGCGDHPSHPSRVRGLKHDRLVDNLVRSGVAPFTGAWIETTMDALDVQRSIGRTLHGCVD